MIVCIIAGGSGTRLWPLSQPDYPKHLLNLTGDRSLLQNTYDRVRQITDTIYVITEASHADDVRKQLPEMPADHAIVEPGRRGTASCIVLALATIAPDHPNETIAFVHADHHITDTAGFVRTVQAAGLAAAEAQKITLIGLKPTHPATGFGYIKIGDQTDELMGLPVHEVERFEEKPAYDVAKKYVSEGQYFWNLGLFVAPVATFLTVMKHSAPDLAEAYRTLKKLKGDELKEAYLKLESQAIDIALIEKTDQILVLPGEFDWADVGSYLDLHKILKSKDDNSVEGEVYQVGCSDSMIHGSTRPIIAVGLEGVVVIDTPDGLLVCAKEQSQKVGDLVKQLQQQAKS
jgi:mannose-1-phosphate guanylyltransferase